MRLFISIVFFLSFFTLKAQEKKVALSGMVIGQRMFKYVYFYDSKTEKLGRASIMDRSFKMELKYVSENSKFGELPKILILFSNEEAPINISQSNRIQDQCKVIVSDTISINYNTDRKFFVIGGSAENDLQNQYERNFANYRNQRDSAYKLIDSNKSTVTEKEEKKLKESKLLFLIAVNNIIKLSETYNDSKVALANFSPVIYEQTLIGQIVLEAFEKFSFNLKNSQYGKRLLTDIEDKISSEAYLANPPYVAGMQMPHFKLKNENQIYLESVEVEGKYILIDFWASWCVPCRKETPNLLKAYQTFKTKGFKIITISLDEVNNAAKWREALKIDGMGDFINLINDAKESDIVQQLKISAIPANFLIDNKGKIVDTNLRGDLLNNKLTQLFKEQN